MRGHVDAGFEPVREAFARNFEQHGEVGAACCVHLRGRVVVDLWGGWTAPEAAAQYSGDTLQMVLSTTKGLVAVCAHILAQESLLDFDAPVVEYWPEFGQAGKDGVKVRSLFSHRAGLAAVDRSLTLEDLYAWEPVVDALAAQPPLWTPDSAHGYHALTYGWLAGEVIRRVAGMTVGRFLAERVAGPLGLDVWIGLPSEQLARVAPLIPPRARPAGAAPDPFAASLADPTSLLHRALLNPPTMFGAFNDPAMAAAEVPATNAIGTARSISRLYAACIGEVDGIRLLTPETVDRATRTRREAPTWSSATKPGMEPAFSCRFPTGRWPVKTPSGTTGWEARLGSPTRAWGSLSPTS